ncbi:MAG TPA: energy transducer TonB [Stellaceae bacterium]|nr:energy transducer TonB [Stellaceae bacterium]HMD66874.1 energy transducer TonB [Stellaceae bacterium]
MSVATAEPALTEEPVVLDAVPDGIAPPGIALSVALHLVLGSLFIFGLPRLFAPPPPEDMPVAVELVTIAPETRATRPNPNPPRPDAKPEVPVADAPVARPEPEPPVPTPVPPPSAEAPPPTSEPPTPSEPKPAPPPLLKPPEPKPEPPKPTEKTEAPRPKEKPEPPQQMAKNETKAEQKKYDPSQFEALLKNLATQPTAPSPDAPPQRPRVTSARPSSQPRAPLGSQITATEVDLVRQQIARCWNVPAGARDAKDLVVEIRVVVDPDGTVRQATIVDQARLSDPSFRAAAESARRAFFNPECRPLRLPPDKYAIWKDLVVDFSPKDIL